MSLVKGGFRRLSSWNSSLFKQLGLPPKDVSASQSLLPFTVSEQNRTVYTLWMCRFSSGLAPYKIYYHKFNVVLEVTDFLRSATGIREGSNPTKKNLKIVCCWNDGWMHPANDIWKGKGLPCFRYTPNRGFIFDGDNICRSLTILFTRA